jgi:small subunit ribosomal protein S5
MSSNKTETNLGAVDKSNEYKEVLASVGRVAKVVKGGRRFSFSVVMIVGDGKGNVGYGLGKAREVTEARAKATQEAKKSVIRVPLKEGRTLFHDVVGHSGAGKVLLRTAKPGTGVIAGGPMRAVFEVLGVHDVVAKSLGSSNVHNMLSATFNAFERLATPRSIADKRNKKIGEIMDTAN